MTQRQQLTVVLVSVKCIILSMIEGTNDEASKGEHGGETYGAREYGRMRRWTGHVSRRNSPNARASSSTSAMGRDSRRPEYSRVFLEGLCGFCGGASSLLGLGLRR